jgi:predicted nucleic acid-binding protein
VTHFLCDASALAKRYVHEMGTPLMHQLFRQAPQSHLSCVLLSAGEVIAVVVRRRNDRRITAKQFRLAMAQVRTELLQAGGFAKGDVTPDQIRASWLLIEKHSINCTDALILRVALDRAAELKRQGSNLVLVASDQRLLRAADDEGLQTFNPETGAQAELEALATG